MIWYRDRMMIKQFSATRLVSARNEIDSSKLVLKTRSIALKLVVKASL